MSSAATPVTSSARSSVQGSSAGGVLLEAAGCSFDEAHVDQSGVDDLAADGVGQSDVGADVQAEPALGPAGGGGAARIDDEDAGAASRAARTWWKKIGWVSRAFEPQMTMTSAVSAS